MHSLRSYAKHRADAGLPGGSLRAVQKAIEAGRLPTAAVKFNGTWKIRDVAAADAEWASNTDHSRSNDETKAKAAAAPAPTSRTVVGELEPQPHGGALKRTRATDDGEDEDTVANWSAEEKQWRAKMAELKYLEAAGQLVNADEVKAEIVDKITACRTHLLGLASRLKQLLPHLTLGDIAVVEAEVRRCLEELVPA